MKIPKKVLTGHASSWITQEDYDKWLEDLFKNCPESWDEDQDAESILTEYIHALECRLLAYKGSLEKYGEDELDVCVATRVCEIHGSIS